MAKSREGLSQVCCYVEGQVKEAFKVLCTREGLTMDGFLSEKILEAVISKGYYSEPSPSQYESLAELVKAREKELLLAKFSKEKIKNIKAGQAPEEKLDLLEIAIALGISAEDMKVVYQKSNFKQGATNGNGN
jgi:hypothetical protein